MKLVIGLGNPGPEYAQTRHNLGFMVADELATQWKAAFRLWGQGKHGDLAQAERGGEKVLLLKPLTFMNLSGHAAVEAAHFFKVLPEDICVIHDDLDLPLGHVRLKVGGGDGGHNGLKSLTKSLATNEYRRVRMGIGRPENPGHETHNWVLSGFGKADEAVVSTMIERAVRGVEAFVAGADRFQREMNTLNQRGS